MTMVREQKQDLEKALKSFIKSKKMFTLGEWSQFVDALRTLHHLNAITSGQLEELTKMVNCRTFGED
jgi:hypothetical protein